MGVFVRSGGVFGAHTPSLRAGLAPHPRPSLPSRNPPGRGLVPTPKHSAPPPHSSTRLFWCCWSVVLFGDLNIPSASSSPSQCTPLKVPVKWFIRRVVLCGSVEIFVFEAGHLCSLLFTSYALAHPSQSPPPPLPPPPPHPHTRLRGAYVTTTTAPRLN